MENNKQPQDANFEPHPTAICAGNEGESSLPRTSTIPPITDDNGHPRMYDILVDDQDDFFGIIAYSVYKRQKREQVNQYHVDNGRYPTNGDLSAFYQIAKSPMQQEHFRQQALELMSAFCQQVLDDKTNEIDDEYKNKFNERCEKLKPHFWFGVWQSVVGSLVFLLAIGVIMLILWGFQSGPQGVVERLFNVKITTVPEDKDSRLNSPES